MHVGLWLLGAVPQSGGLQWLGQRPQISPLGVGWNPSESMENVFDCLGDSYVLSTANTPAYTVDQMINKVKTAI